MKKQFLCPHCQSPIETKLVSGHMGSLGTGKAKARTPEQARKAVMVRWEKYYKLNPEKRKK